MRITTRNPISEQQGVTLHIKSNEATDEQKLEGKELEQPQQNAKLLEPDRHPLFCFVKHLG